MSTVATVSRIVSSYAQQYTAKLEQSVQRNAAPKEAVSLHVSSTAVTGKYDSSAFKVSISKAAADLANG